MSLIQAIAGCLRNVATAPVTGITYIGSSGWVGSGNATATLTLPAGSQAGDTALLLCDCDSNGATFTPPTGSVTAYDSQWGVDTQTTAAFAYQLTATDITTGSLSIGITNGYDDNVVLLVFRGVSSAPVDVAAFTAGTASGASPVTCTADGITTTKNGDMLVGQFTPDTDNEVAMSWGSAPSGWTLAKTQNSARNSTPTAIIYTPQTSAGATGNQSMVYTGSSATPGGGLIALKRAAPFVSLNISALPTSVTVGTAFSKTVTATNGDGATGAITITAPSLPPGLSIGSTTVSGGVYSATISGTPTTEAATAAFAIGASNGTQSTSQNWNVAVNNASSLTLVGTYNGDYRGTNAVPYTVTTGIAVDVGDTIIVAIAVDDPASTGSGATLTSITDTASSGLANQKWYSGTRYVRGGVYMGVATVASANLALTVNFAAKPVVYNGSYSNGEDIQVYVLRGETLTLDATSIQTGDIDYGAGNLSLPPCSSNRGFMLAMGWSSGSSSDNGGSLAMTPTSYTTDNSGGACWDSTFMHQITTAAVSGQVVGVTSPAPTSYLRLNGMVMTFNY